MVLVADCGGCLGVSQIDKLFYRKFAYAIQGESQFFQDVGGISREIYRLVFKEIFADSRSDLGLVSVLRSGTCE